MIEKKNIIIIIINKNIKMNYITHFSKKFKIKMNNRKYKNIILIITQMKYKKIIMSKMIIHRNIEIKK